MIHERAAMTTSLTLIQARLSLALIAALTCFPSLAQAPATGAQTAPQTPVLKVKTRLVIVDVVARTNKGELVTDLKESDFTLEEDGKAQEIRSFSFQQPAAEVAGVQPIAALAEAPDSFNNLPHYKPMGALNIVLLDGLNSTMSNQAYMRDSMLKVLTKLPPDQPVSVYVLGNKLQMVQDFTSDPALLKAAVAGAKVQGSRVLENPAGTSAPSDVPPGNAAAALLAATPRLAAQIQGFKNERIAAQTDFRVRYTLEALNSLARALAGYPGRKNLIWISETFPFNLFQEAAGAQHSPGPRQYSADIALTGTLLSDAQVAVYPIDPRGVVNNSTYSVGSDPNPMSGTKQVDSSLRGPLGAQMAADSVELTAARTTMNDLADKTGGMAFYNRSDLDTAVRESMSDGSSYYTLGYYPANKDWNGAFRKIHVKVNRSGVKVRYRLGYLAIDREAFTKLNPGKQDEELDQALSLDWPVSTGLPFQAQVVAPSAQTQNQIVIRYKIDPRALNFQSGDDGLQRVSVLCAARVFPVKGLDKAIKTDGNKMAGALKPEAYTKVIGSFFPCQEQFELPPGDYVLRLGVRDNTTGAIGTANAKLTVNVAGETKP